MSTPESELTTSVGMKAFREWRLKLRDESGYAPNEEECWLEAWNHQQKEIDRMREVLKFYADPANYCCTIEMGSDGKLQDGLCPILKDDGKKSRESLNQ